MSVTSFQKNEKKIFLRRILFDITKANRIRLNLIHGKKFSFSLRCTHSKTPALKWQLYHFTIQNYSSEKEKGMILPM